MWREESVLIIALGMSVTSVVPKPPPKNFKRPRIPGKGVQKPVLLDTCATVRRFLNLPSTIQ